jgi:hypothetical protein
MGVTEPRRVDLMAASGHISFTGHVLPNGGSTPTHPYVYVEIVSDGVRVNEDGCDELEPGSYVLTPSGLFKSC